MSKPEYDSGNVVTLTKTDEPGGGWLTVDSSERPGETTRDRVGRHISTTLEGAGDPTRANLAFARLLTSDQLQVVYQRVPDVRAAIDSIVRQIATWDWVVKPRVHPSDERYKEALVAAETVRRFLQAPNEDGETWQELMTKMVTDLMVYDAGVIENVFDTIELPDGKKAPGADLQEFVALRGSDILPVIDQFGRVLAYQQLEYDAAIIPQFSSTASDPTADANRNRPVFMPRQINLFRLFPSTATTAGQPLIETIVNEIIAMMRSGEHSMLAFDSDEIPPGILVITGVSGAAAEAAKQELRRMRGKDHKVRVVTSPDPAATGAKWVELRHTAKDVDFVNVVKEIRRTIWRVFGVLPVEMGVSEDVPRSTGQVQLDVSSSHLIAPVLELIEGKVNARMLRLIVPEDVSHLITFKFDREFKLTPSEQKDKAESLRSLVGAGVVTRNEARAELDLPPIVGGDTVLIETPIGLVPLEQVLNNAAAAGAVDDDDDPDDDDDGGTSGGGSGGGGTGEVDDPSAGSPSDGDGAPGEASMQRRAVLDLPSEWQPRGMFKDVRTLDLSRLGESVSMYARLVGPLFDDAESQALALISQRYDADTYDDETAIALMGEIGLLLDALQTKWAFATAGLYRQAAQIGRDAAVNWTGAQVVDNWEERAEVYRQNAMGYLARPGGIISDLRVGLSQALLETVFRSKDERQEPELDEGGFPIVGAAAVQPRQKLLSAVATVFAVNFFRIHNWGGRLVELSNDIFTAGVTDGSSVPVDGVATATEWWCEWVCVGDNAMCETCATICEGNDDRGYWRVSDLPTRPGGQTECRARCRCVLVLWTEDEISRGVAVRLNEVSAR